IIDLAERYPEIEGQEHHEKEKRRLRSLPPKLKSGSFGMTDLEDIGSWVNARFIPSMVKKNDLDEARQVLKRVQETDDVEEKIVLLSELHGVSTQTASAFLVHTDPDEFVMMSDRSIEAL
ncbi:hypothetical protein, partial [Haloferax profundi]|uniref:hypothetical protein n=1 Tax=Haloferax profundi TaxID=1544718 RepID=UPI000B189D77